MLIALALVWAGTFFFAAIAVVEIPPLTIAFLRVSGAALVLLLALYLMGILMPREGRVWAAFFWMGLFNNAIPFSLIFWAQTELTSGVASILNATMPVFTVIAAHLLTKDEKMTKMRFLGVVLGFLGILVLIGSPISGSIWAHLADFSCRDFLCPCIDLWQAFCADGREANGNSDRTSYMLCHYFAAVCANLGTALDKCFSFVPRYPGDDCND